MQNSEYSRKSKYNSAMSIYVDGSTAYQIKDEPLKKTLTPRQEEELKRRKAIRAAKVRKAEAKRRMKIAAFGTAVGAVFVMLIVMTLNGTVKNNELMNQIGHLESEYSELQAQNNSKEYDIKKSVDLNTVIQVATDELGMVRSSAGQIINYSTIDTEYIQQVADRPGN